MLSSGILLPRNSWGGCFFEVCYTERSLTFIEWLFVQTLLNKPEEAPRPHSPRSPTPLSLFFPHYTDALSAWSQLPEERAAEVDKGGNVQGGLGMPLCFPLQAPHPAPATDSALLGSCEVWGLFGFVYFFLGGESVHPSHRLPPPALLRAWICPILTVNTNTFPH